MLQMLHHIHLFPVSWRSVSQICSSLRQRFESIISPILHLLTLIFKIAPFELQISLKNIFFKESSS